MKSYINKIKNTLIHLSFGQLFLVLVVFIVALILIRLVFTQLITQVNQNINNQVHTNTSQETSVGSQTKDSIGNLNQNIVSIGNNKYSLNGNIIYIDNGHITYTVYDYHPTPDELKKIATFFKLNVNDIVVVGDEFTKDVNKSQQIEDPNNPGIGTPSSLPSNYVFVPY